MSYGLGDENVIGIRAFNLKTHCMTSKKYNYQKTKLTMPSGKPKYFWNIKLFNASVFNLSLFTEKTNMYTFLFIIAQESIVQFYFAAH